jgi:P27 family predicted phage terminase small subunit
MRGRKPKPTAMKILAGNPGKRAVNRSEPKPNPGIPQCPDHLHGEARVEWDRITIELGKMGLLTQADRAAIAAYCCSYGRWSEAERIVAKGMVYTPRKKKIVGGGKGKKSVELEESSGLMKVNPAVGIAHDAMVLMHKYLSEFGLSPASRSRLHVGGELSPEDEYEKFLGQTG